MNSPSTEDIIARVIELRNTKNSLVSEHKAEEAKYDEAIDNLENYLLSVMIERNEDQIKTKAGTAYKAPQLRAQLTDRPALIGFVTTSILNGRLNVLDIFTNAVSKDYIREYVKESGAAPPGVETQTYIKCNVRKS
jgi:hypothetical protein